MTVTGFGPVAALPFKVGLNDPRRFARSRTVGAHFGVAPRQHESGTLIDYEGRLSKQGDVAVREALCEAAASCAAGEEMGCLARVGATDRQAVKHAARDRRCCEEAGKHSASDVSQRDRLPCRFRRQSHAAAALEACAVAAVQMTTN
jgi:hypothetical protein